MRDEFSTIQFSNKDGVSHDRGFLVWFMVSQLLFLAVLPLVNKKFLRGSLPELLQKKKNARLLLVASKNPAQSKEKQVCVGRLVGRHAALTCAEKL